MAAAEATDRLHEIVALLRADQPRLPSELSEESLTALIAEAEAAGMVIHHDVDLPCGYSTEPRHALSHRTIHRLVKETLTNAAKHAPGAAVDLSVRQEGDTVRLMTRNPLPAPDARGAEPAFASSGGGGLRALAERVRVLGGTLDWRSLEGHFTLAATMPAVATPSVENEAHTLDVDPRTYRAYTMDRRRRSLWTLVLAPLGVILCTLLLLAAVFTFTTIASVLSTDRFAGIRPGQDRAEAEALLPLVEMHDAPVADEPVGERRYYEESVSFFERVDVFQVCFADGAVAHTATIPAEQGR